MKLVYNRKASPKLKSRLKKKVRIRKKVEGTAERPRLNVFKSARHMYVQIIDDVSGNTLVSSSTLKMGAKTGSREAAKTLGAEIAKKAESKNIKDVVFDRNGFIYHGRIKALADSAREAGLNF